MAGELVTELRSVGNMSELKNHRLQEGGARVCKQGFVKRIVKRNFVIVKEGEPLWMWSLKSLHVRKLFILKKATIGFLDSFKSKFSDKLKLIGSGNITFVSFACLSEVPRSCTLVASGSLFFLYHSAMVTNLTETFVVNNTWRRRSLPKSKNGLQWIRAYAPQFGCPVAFTLILGSHGDPGALPQTDLRRSIRHFLDYGVKPKCFRGQVDESVMYTEGLLVNPLHIFKEVVYPTHFSSTGWGICQLTPTELMDCFGVVDCVDINLCQQTPPNQFFKLRLQ